MAYKRLVLEIRMRSNLFVFLSVILCCLAGPGDPQRRMHEKYEDPVNVFLEAVPPKGNESGLRPMELFTKRIKYQNEWTDVFFCKSYKSSSFPLLLNGPDYCALSSNFWYTYLFHASQVRGCITGFHALRYHRPRSSMRRLLSRARGSVADSWRIGTWRARTPRTLWTCCPRAMSRYGTTTGYQILLEIWNVCYNSFTLRDMPNTTFILFHAHRLYAKLLLFPSVGRQNEVCSADKRGKGQLLQHYALRR